MNLAIIGCGNIGFRHFQSILNLESDCQIFLIDNSVTALNNCKKYLDANPNSNLKVNFLDDINKICSFKSVNAIEKLPSISSINLIKDFIMLL